MHAAGWLAGPDGDPLVTSLALVKSWGNPYGPEQTARMRPWAIYSGVFTGELPPGLLDATIRWLACPVFLQPIDLPLATTRRGETVEARASLAGRLPEGWRQFAAAARPRASRHTRAASRSSGLTPTFTRASPPEIGRRARRMPGTRRAVRMNRPAPRYASQP